MLRVESNTKLEGFTEFEEDILFDEDDPDFQQDVSSITVFRVRSNMSATVGAYPAEHLSHHSSLSTLDRSLDDVTDAAWNLHDHVLTIEELRLQMSSCFTCGVSWNDSHVSLDCVECGGYALERPCPECEGSCGMMWKRDLSLSHSSNKARWEGKCGRKQLPDLEECRASLKQLSTNS